MQKKSKIENHTKDMLYFLRLRLIKHKIFFSVQWVPHIDMLHYKSMPNISNTLKDHKLGVWVDRKILPKVKIYPTCLRRSNFGFFSSSFLNFFPHYFMNVYVYSNTTQKS